MPNSNPFVFADLQAEFPELELEDGPLGEGSFKVAYRARAGRRDVVLKLIKEPLESADSDESPGLPPRVERELRKRSATEGATGSGARVGA